MRNVFDGLDDEDRRAVLAMARRRTFRAGDKVFWQGDLGDSLHIVVKGSFVASVADPLGSAVIVAVFRVDDAFGELAMLGAEQRRNATIIALEPSETMSLAQADFDRWRAERPQVDRALLRALAERMQEMTDQMVEALYVPVETRVARRLLLLREALEPQSKDGWIKIRQEELAAFCGITRQTVNKVLRQFADSGHIGLRRGGYRVVSVTGLRAEAK